jgi:carboxyl-terminal processing protease
MVVPDGPALHSLSNAMTLELWLKAASFSQQNGAVHSLLRKNGEAGSENFYLRFRMVSGKPYVEMMPGKETGVLRAPCELETSKWYHLAATYDGNVIRAFINGTPLGSMQASGAIEIDDSELLVGRGDPDYSGGEYFDGMLDAIRIWNVARSEKDIKASLHTRVAASETGLLAYWDFDDGTPRDVSGHGQTGALKGQASIESSVRRPISAVDTPASYAPKPSAPSPDKWLATLEEFWTRLSGIYPALEYKGINGISWMEPAAKRVRSARTDEEFYGILLELMASLNDTHTRITSYPGQPASQRPAVVLNRVDGRVAVIRADPITGLAAGEVIVSVDGKPSEEYLANVMKRVCNSTERGRVREACSRLLAGPPGTTVTITVEGADKVTRQVQLRRDSKGAFWNDPTISSRKLGGSVGYVRISRWGGENLVAQFDRALEEFKDYSGLIIDVRGNGGGDDKLADQVNGRLIEKAVVSSIDFWRQEGTDQYRRTIGWVQPRGPWTFKGRVAVLIDEGCASACEHFVSGIEAMGSVLLIGTPTNGAGGGPTGVTLKDGTRLQISRALGLRANGVVFEGHGIPPHIVSTPSLQDLRQNRDAALELANEWLLSSKAVPDRSGVFTAKE